MSQARAVDIAGRIEPDEPTKAFGWLQKAVMTEAYERLTSGARLVLAMIQIHADNDTRECYPSISRLMRLTGFADERTVSRAIAEAEESGLIQVIRARGKSNRYILAELKAPTSNVGTSKKAPTKNAGTFDAPPTKNAPASDAGSSHEVPTFHAESTHTGWGSNCINYSNTKDNARLASPPETRLQEIERNTEEHHNRKWVLNDAAAGILLAGRSTGAKWNGTRMPGRDQIAKLLDDMTRDTGEDPREVGEQIAQALGPDHRLLERLIGEAGDGRFAPGFSRWLTDGIWSMDEGDKFAGLRRAAGDKPKTTEQKLREYVPLLSEKFKGDES